VYKITLPNPVAARSKVWVRLLGR